MKLAAIFPTPEIGTDPTVIRDWAQAAEDLGYDSIVAYDHVLGAEHADREPPLVGPYTEHDAFHEPLVLFGYLAAVTRRIELATGVLILPQRQTALVAKQAAEVDILSGGRLRLAVGSGWSWVEYDALGQAFASRGKRLTEQVELLRRLWTEPVLDYQGEFDRVERAGLLPKPGKIPIWFGGFTEVALRRAALLGDGLMFGTNPTQMAALCERQLQLLEEAGRDAASFGLEAAVDYSQGADVWQAELEVWRKLGGTHLTLRAMDTAAVAVGFQEVGYKGPADYIRALEEFKAAVG